MKFFLTSILLGITLLPASALAQNFLVGIPGIGSPTGDFDGYINAIYAMFISIAALLAVVKIVIAGVKYMFTDIVPQKTQAKQDIQGAIFGLVLILGAVLILTVINPDLTNFNLEQSQIALPAPIVVAEGNEFSDLEQAISEGAVGRNCIIIGCEAEILLCENGGFFESDLNRLGDARVITTGNNNSIFCQPTENAIEILARLNEERLIAVSNICNENTLYTWNTTSNRCMSLSQELEIITLVDILDFNTSIPEYQRVLALLSEEYGRDYIEDNLQDFIDGAIPISFNICSTIDGGQGIYTSRNNTSCQYSAMTESEIEAPTEYQFVPITEAF